MSSLFVAKTRIYLIFIYDLDRYFQKMLANYTFVMILPKIGKKIRYLYLIFPIF